MIQQIRKRTDPEDIIYSLHLYFNGLSLRNTSKAISRFIIRSYTAIRNWIQKYKPAERYSYCTTKTSEFLYILKDETHLKVGSKVIWL